jgi:hypothetical protein
MQNYNYFLHFRAVNDGLLWNLTNSENSKNKYLAYFYDMGTDKLIESYKRIKFAEQR